MAALALFMAGAVPVAATPLLLLMPFAAEARPGSGSSFGSRGSRTYTAPPPTNTAPAGAMPFGRSMTQRPAPYGNGYGSNYVPQRHPLATGFMGGLIGAGIGGLLLGHGLFGAHLGLGGLLGLLLQLAIAVVVIRWLIRRFTNGRPNAPAVSRDGTAYTPNTPPLGVQQQDFRQFEQILQQVQQAWSLQDLPALQRLATPEMVAYFNEQLSDLASRGLRNTVSDVRLEKGDLSEAWAEGGRDYATVAMRYSLMDVTRDPAGRVVEGDPAQRSVVTEFWTFTRTIGGGWLLSAIQQSR